MGWPSVLPGAFFVQERTRIFVAKYKNVKADKDGRTPHVSEADFLDLFYENEELKHVEPNIQGYKPEGKGTYQVTFYEINQDINELERVMYGEGHDYRTPGGIVITIQLYKPRVPTKTVTFRPVPFEYDLDSLKSHLNKMNWGTPLHVTRGLHKQVGNRRRLENEFVHVKYAAHDLKENLIPPAMDLEGHYVYIAKPNQPLRNQCTYCQGFWHSEDRCFKKQRDSENASKCSFCGIPGHDESNCVKKIMVDEEIQLSNLEKNNGQMNAVAAVEQALAASNQTSASYSEEIDASKTKEQIKVSADKILPAVDHAKGDPTDTPPVGANVVVEISQDTTSKVPIEITQSTEKSDAESDKV